MRLYALLSWFRVSSMLSDTCGQFLSYFMEGNFLTSQLICPNLKKMLNNWEYSDGPTSTSRTNCTVVRSPLNLIVTLTGGLNLWSVCWTNGRSDMMGSSQLTRLQKKIPHYFQFTCAPLHLLCPTCLVNSQLANPPVKFKSWVVWNSLCDLAFTHCWNNQKLQAFLVPWHLRRSVIQEVATQLHKDMLIDLCILHLHNVV